MRGPEKRNTTEAFRTEVDVERVLHCLALHAQSLFGAAACLGAPKWSCPAEIAPKTWSTRC